MFINEVSSLIRVLGLSSPGEFAAKCPGPAGTTACCPHHVRCTLCPAPSEVSLLFVTSQVVEGLYLGNIRGECLSLLHLCFAMGSLGRWWGRGEPFHLGAPSACSHLGNSASSSDPKPLQKSPSQLQVAPWSSPPGKGHPWGAAVTSHAGAAGNPWHGWKPPCVC